MTQVPLTGGFYKARSLIANAQRCVNLYPEINQQDAPAPSTHYLTPGLVGWSTVDTEGAGRGMYYANNGELYVVVGQIVYLVEVDKTWTPVITLTTTSGMVSMKDNGTVLCVVDGSDKGYVIDLETKLASPISTPSFYGSVSVGYVDTYLTFTRPDTNQFYITTSNLILEDATKGPIATGSVTVAGVKLLNGTYSAVALTGGTGIGATANITVTGGTVVSLVLVSPGAGYSAGDVLAIPAVPLTGPLSGFSINSAGVNLNPGTYLTVATTGGSGTGVQLELIVDLFTRTATSFGISGGSGGGGDGYAAGQVLTAVGVPGGSGAVQPSINVTAVNTMAATAPAYTVGTVTSGNTVNPLDVAAKTGFADKIVNHVVVHREIWLIGDKTTEVWYNTGAADFTFAPQPGVFIEHGCLAPYSVAVTDLTPFWLAQDRDGNALVVQGEGYQAKRVSTHAIENAIQKYIRLDDAVAFIYQQDGHVFYVLNFPTADATWVYDLATKLWHERVWTDDEGLEHRARPIAYANAFGLNLCQDWETGELYEYKLGVFTDNGRQVVRRRGFPHIKNEQKRVEYVRFIADISTGEQANGLSAMPPQVFLRWSDDAGKSWSNPVAESMGATGQFLTCPQWLRLGIARDRVFELFWSEPVETALNSAYVDMIPAET